MGLPLVAVADVLLLTAACATPIRVTRADTQSELRATPEDLRRRNRRSSHSTQDHPETIGEVQRILYKHIAGPGASSSHR
jgi:Flp pilus assembly protein TadD